MSRSILTRCAKLIAAPVVYQEKEFFSYSKGRNEAIIIRIDEKTARIR
jgi:hypothetical protein